MTNFVTPKFIIKCDPENQSETDPQNDLSLHDFLDLSVFFLHLRLTLTRFIPVQLVVRRASVPRAGHAGINGGKRSPSAHALTGAKGIVHAERWAGH